MKAVRQIVALSAGAALLIALVVTASFWTFRQIEITAEARRDAHDLLNGANDLLAALIDAETGQRGYLLTGDEAFLEPYLAVRGGIKGRLDGIRRLTLTAAANERLDELAPLIDAKLMALSQNIDLRRNHDMPAALENVRGSRGKPLMDSIRAVVRGFIQIEEEALAQREAAFQSSLRRLFALIIVASLSSVLLAVSFVWLFHRRTRQRLKDIVHIETLHLLEKQEEANARLQQVNVTLQESEEKLAVTLNSIGDAVIATDATGLVTMVNPLAERLTGWTRAEAVGGPIDRIFHIINQQSRQPVSTPIAKTLAHGTIQGLANHTVLIARDGGECAIADSCAPIRGRDGQVAGAVLVFRDVTKEYAIQQALRDSRVEAEKANLAKSEFLSSMSHELRSPLNAILGFAQLMETDSPPPTSSQKDSISQILSAGWHLLKLIGEVLDLAKVESRKVPLSREPVSLAEVMVRCQGMIEPQAQELGIRMIFPPPGMHHFVLADRTRVKQVILNLLSNAIKYNTKAGTVVVTCAASAPGRIRVSIRDTGAGLDQKQLAQLFQAFNRLGQEGGGVEGTGIGLVVAKRLIELMGGTVGVESTVGVGSVFWFELEAVDEPQLPVGEHEAVSLAKPLLPPGSRLHTLLYVEDNPANLKLIEKIIARHPDIHLHTAVTGNSGVAMAREFLPDVVLMDINLPDIDGFEALRLIRSDPATALIPVVALSANAMPRDVERGLQAGFIRYITKPIKVAEFMEAMNAALEFSGRGGEGSTKKEGVPWPIRPIS